MGKYVLLDTDFISKGHIVQTDSEHHLIDLVMDFHDCEFFCHEKTVEELAKHNVGDSSKWLTDQISSGQIHCLSDKKIIETLWSTYKEGAIPVFCTFFKKSCNVFESGYYEKHFGVLSKMKDAVSIDDFLEELRSCEARIGEGQSLGEKKSYILLQMLQIIYPGKVYIFCSDDRDARRNIISIGNVKCVSILSLFCELKYRGFMKQDVEPFFRSYENFCQLHNQKDFKVWIEDRGWKRISVPSSRVLEDIFTDKIEEMERGDLMYSKNVWRDSRK